MTYKDFEKERVEALMKDTLMGQVFDTVMKTRVEHDFHGYFDFSYNKNICYSSDYGGENNQSQYNVYTFTFFSYSSLELWQNELDNLRLQKGYNKPAEYKMIDPNSRKGKLRDWLELSEKYFKGMVVSFAIDKKLDSLFAPTKDILHEQISLQAHFSDCNLSPNVLEKAFRISNFSNLILSQVLGDGYGFWWMSDRDAIANGKERWQFTVKLHGHILRHYCEHLTDVQPGYSLPFTKEERTHFSEDFLSLSDLFSGAMDDFCNHFQGKTSQELSATLKPKSIEILSYLKKLPTFIYVLDTDGTNSKCRRVVINIVEDDEGKME